MSGERSFFMKNSEKFNNLKSVNELSFKARFGTKFENENDAF